MRVPAAVSTALRHVVIGPVQPAEWLGVSASALYLLTRSSDVLAIVTHNAIRLPCALVLPATAGELPLTRLAGAPGCQRRAPASVGAGRVEWAGPDGTVIVAAAREWAPARVTIAAPLPAALDSLTRAVAGRDIGVDRRLIVRLAQCVDDPAGQYAAVGALLGRGPGLTPSGDDVVAGFLLGARAFGRATPGAVAAVLGLARSATTALSAQLLRHAVAGECIPEVAAVLAELAGQRAPGDALGRLLAVGHTSGAALAEGLLVAAEPIAIRGAGMTTGSKLLIAMRTTAMAGVGSA